MSPVTLIRRTAPTDGTLLRQLRIAALADAPYAFGAKLSDVLAEPPESFESTAVRHSQSETSTSFFAFCDNEPIGTIGAYIEQQPLGRAFICALWLAPEQRGTSTATELVHTACSWLRQSTHADIFAWVADSNARAFAFYRKLGFLPTSQRQPLPSNPSAHETLLRLAYAGG